MSGAPSITGAKAQRWLDRRLALAAFVAALLVYLASGSAVPDSHDTTPNAYVAVSVLNDGDAAFSASEMPFLFRWSGGAGRDERRLVGPRYFLVPTSRRRPGDDEALFVSAFGPAAGLVALPAAALAQAFGSDLQRDPMAVFRSARVTAALLTAGSVALVFLTAAGFTTRARALLLAAAYAFGTCVWSISSNSLWQQTPALFFLSLGTLCLTRGGTAWSRGAAAGLAFSVAAACRPTAALAALAAAAYLLAADRRSLAAYLLAALPVGVAAMAHNAYYFGFPLEFGQLLANAPLAERKTGSAALWQTPIWVGAAGLLASPSRGLLVFSPFLGAAFAGAVIAWREPRYRSLRFIPVAVLLLWLPSFMWFDWWGGWTYGYRPIVDSVPLLAVLCIPVLENAFARPALKVLLLAAVAWSVAVQALGVLAYTPSQWNARVVDGVPADVDLPEHRVRLWSLRDSQIGFLVANFSEARAARLRTP